MKVIRFVRLFAIAALATASLGAGQLSAATIFSDDFESGSMSNWTQTSANAGTGLVNSTAQNVSPAGGSRSAAGDSSADRMHRNIIADNGGSELSGYSRFTSWIYDDGNNGTTGASRIYNELRSYAGTGLPNGGTAADGALSQLIAIGKMNQPTGFGSAFTATKYQGRITSAFGGQSGYFNLDNPGAPSRSVGWHKFVVERSADGKSLKFFVDDFLAKTLTGTTALPSWDTLVIGPGTGSQAGNFYIDGVKLESIPEPATLALAGMGLLGMVSFARRKNA